MKTPTQNLAAALRILANDIESPDGVANAAIAEAAERLNELAAQVEYLKGIKPELPPRPPQGDGLPRYGIKWNGEYSPITTPMDDGYWTPYHLATQHLREIQADAGRTGYLQGAKEWCKIGNENDELMLSDADEYANRIRNGGDV